MKKLLCVLLAALMVLSMFAGCGKQEANEPAAENAQAENAAAPQEKTEISFISWRAQDADAYKAMIADFEAKNPDIKVNLEVTSNDNTEYYTVLKSRLISGEGADVLMVQPGAYIKELVDADYLLDLTDTGLADTMNPEFLDAGIVYDKLYSLIQTYNSCAIYYNKDLFEELDITVPTNYASFLEACQKSVDGGYMPVAAGFGEAWVTGILYESLMSYYGGGDNNVFHALETGEAKLTDEVYVNIFEDIAQMVKDGVFQDSAIGTTYEGSMSLFASGRATMLIDGTWNIGNLMTMNEDMNFGLTRIPCTKDTTVGLFQPSQGVSINKHSKNIEAAKRFVAYMFSIEGMELYCNGTKQASVVVGTQLDVPELDMMNELMEGETVIWPDTYIERAELVSIFDDLSSRIVAGSTDIMAELEKSQQEIDAMIAE